MSLTICGVVVSLNGQPCQKEPRHWHDRLTAHRIPGLYGNEDWIDYGETVNLEGKHSYVESDRASRHRLPSSAETTSPMPRRFTLERTYDVSGVSGLGTVAYGIIWPDQRCAIHWVGEHPSTVVWDNLYDAMDIHGHQGATTVKWLDSGD